MECRWIPQLQLSQAKTNMQAPQEEENTFILMNEEKSKTTIPTHSKYQLSDSCLE
jgi:hypothetical protein